MNDLFLPLFASDLAKDVRAEFEEKLRYGMSVEEATGAVVEAFREALARAEEGPVVILALAVLQLREKRLHASIRDAALGLLREGDGFAARPGEALGLRREREALRQALIAAMEGAETIQTDTPE
jgi:hypothetical protein